jgi:hypothetical protein
VAIFAITREVFLYLIYFYPLIFVLGWLPHPKTFCMVVLENIHMHCFGGTGTVSFLGSVVEILFDLVATGLLVGTGYYSVSSNSFGRDYVSGVYGGLLVSACYFLSRCPSNPLLYWEAIKELIRFVVSRFKISGKQGGTVVVTDENSQQRIKAFEQNLEGVKPLVCGHVIL